MSNQSLENTFEAIFRHSLAGEGLGAHEKDWSEIFEFIATRLFGAFPSRKGRYFDGAVGLVATVKTSRQIEFHGEMWVGDNQHQWTEPFRAILTDERNTKQGVWIVFQIGADRAEGDIIPIFDM